MQCLPDLGHLAQAYGNSAQLIGLPAVYVRMYFLNPLNFEMLLMLQGVSDVFHRVLAEMEKQGGSLPDGSKKCCIS